MQKVFLNTLYISITHIGIKPELGITNFGSNVIFRIARYRYFKKLEKYLEKLSAVTSKITQDLNCYGSSMLTIRKNSNNEYVSEILSLYYYILNLAKKDIVVELKDSSKSITENLDLNYLFNTIEVIHNEEKNYVALYSPKYPYNLQRIITDKILQLNYKIIVTENIHFIDKANATKTWDRVQKIYNAAKASNMMQISELHKLFSGNSDNQCDYCKQQVIFLINDTKYEDFLCKAEHFSSLLRELGVSSIREDFYMPTAFFAQLPCNSRFLKRQFFNISKNVGIFTAIHHRDSGNYRGFRWKPFVTIFRDIITKLPYYFNFHIGEDSGHTLIIAPPGTGASTLTRFLVTQSLKFQPKVINIDLEGSGNDAFINAIGGTIVNIPRCSDNTESPIQLDLFNWSSEQIQDAIEILSEYIIGLNDEGITGLELLISKIIQTPKEDRGQFIKNFIDDNDKDTATTSVKKIIDFLKSPIYSHIFSQDALNIINDHNILNCNFSAIYKDNPNAIELLVALFLLRLPSIIDDKQPKIVLINRVDFIFRLSTMGRYFNDFLEKLTQKNAIVIFGLRDKKKLLQYNNLDEILNNFVTKIFFSDKFIDRMYKRVFKLSESEMHKIKLYDVSKRAFLIKQGDFSMVTSFNLDELPGITEVIC